MMYIVCDAIVGWLTDEIMNCQLHSPTHLAKLRVKLYDEGPGMRLNIFY